MPEGISAIFSHYRPACITCLCNLFSNFEAVKLNKGCSQVRVNIEQGKGKEKGSRGRSLFSCEVRERDKGEGCSQV